jgi:Astacin (Peptidase family M12A)
MGFVISDLGKRWQRGRIPFEINTTAFPVGSANFQAVVAAINYWNNNSDVRLVPHSGEDDFAVIQSSPTICQSPVGRQGGSQQIACAVGVGFGTGAVIHEIGHAFGLFHEHQRPDRNNFVKVTGTGVNFDIPSNGIPVGPYDCCSVMHYGPGTQITNAGAACVSMGQRSIITDGDLAAIRFIYAFSLVDILGDTSDLRVALTSHAGHLFLAWRGSGNDNLNLMFSDDLGISFHGKHTFGDTSSHAPALASHSGRLFLAWKGSGNDNLNVASVDLGPPNNFGIIGLSGKMTLGDSSDFGPALVSHGGRLFLGWRGSGNENLNLSFSDDNGGSFHGTKTFGDTSTDAPSLTSHNGRLMMSWKGSGNDNINVANVDLFSGGSSGIDGLSGKVTIADTTDFSPAIASHQGVLYLAWRGSGNENLNILASTDGGASFHDKRVSAETSTDASTLASHNSSLVTGWKGSGNENINVARVTLSSGPRLVGSNHSGNFLQSSFGNQGNFELLITQGAGLTHFFRNNDAPGVPWFRSGSQPVVPPAGGGIIRRTPNGVAVIQSNFTPDGVHGNLEAVARMTPALDPGGTDSLASYFFDSRTLQWNGPTTLVANGQTIFGVTGTPAFVQSTFGRQGNFELLVPMGNKLVHFFRDNDAPGLPWVISGSQPNVPTGGGGVIPNSPTAVAIIQSNFKGDGTHGNLEAVVRMTPTIDPSGAGDSLVFYFFDSGTLRWSGPFPVVVNGVPVTGVTGNPSLVQSNFGAQGNFELLVPQGNQLTHLVRNNDAPGLPWSAKPSQPTVPAGGGGAIQRSPTGVSLFQSSFRGNCVQGNLEAIVRMTPVLDPDGTGSALVFYFFNSQNSTWNGPFGLMANGQPVNNVGAF